MQFEVLPFGGQQELEHEFVRGARLGGRGAVARGAPGRIGRPQQRAARALGKRPGKPQQRTAPGAGARPGKARQAGPAPGAWPSIPDGRWPGRRPARWPRYPVYGAWPFGVAVPYPQPYPEPYREPEPEPGPESAVDEEPEPGAQGMEGEMPPVFEQAIKQVSKGLPAAQRPAYVSLKTLDDALKDKRSRAPGLYLLVFGGGMRAYSGQSGNVHARLLQHRLCARMLGFDAGRHEVYMAPTPGMTPTQRREVERLIHTAMLKQHRGLLTNQRHELEAEVMGPGWR